MSLGCSFYFERKIFQPVQLRFLKILIFNNALSLVCILFNANGNSRCANKHGLGLYLPRKETIKFINSAEQCINQPLKHKIWNCINLSWSISAQGPWFALGSTFSKVGPKVSDSWDEHVVFSTGLNCTETTVMRRKLLASTGNSHLHKLNSQNVKVWRICQTKIGR